MRIGTADGHPAAATISEMLGFARIVAGFDRGSLPCPRDAPLDSSAIERRTAARPTASGGRSADRHRRPA
jgi:hypothetical protein